MSGHWTEEPDGLHKEFVFHDFSEAFAFMVRVAMISEKLNHHPDWFNSWNRVSISLCTHDNGRKVTEQDFILAAEIDKVYSIRQTI